jgi:ABC-type multidrug transport system fused ATPase/permease subunit
MAATIETEEKTKKRLSFADIKKLLGIYRFLLPYKWQVILSLVLLFLSTGVFFLLIGKFKEIIDADGLKYVNEIAISMGVVILIQGVISYARIILITRFSESALADIRTSLYNKIITLPVEFFEKNRVGDLTSRINSDVTQLQEMLSWSLNEMLRQAVLLVGGVFYILYTNPKLGLVMISTFPVTVGLAFIFGRYVKKLGRKTQDELANANIVVEETFQGIQTVKAFTSEFLESARYRGFINAGVEHALRAGRFRALLVTFVITGVFGGIILMTWYGISEVKTGHLQMGELIRFVILTITIGASVATLGDLYSRLLKTVGASERLLEIFEEKPELALEKNTATSVQEGRIQFENVSFAYPTRTDVTTLKDISFSIAPGEKIALVGQSGSGKSTITRLLIRYYDADAGFINIDGKNVKDYNISDLRNSMGIVPQEVLLFGGSIKENIRYGKPDASDEEIRIAAEQANAVEFIDQFPEGMNTLVGERGIQLSGGQKQRIAIARAVLKNPRILILDEATSSLDSHSEKLVQDALERLMVGRTSIVIAHRLSTIRNVDRILVIKDGRIIEEGKHDDLILQTGGVYANFLKMQQYNTEAVEERI